MKNKLILFDWGNIVEAHLTGYSCHQAWQDLFCACGYKGDKIIFENISKYKVTRIKNNDEFKKVYKEISNDFNLNTTYEEFVKLYKKYFDKIDYYKNVADYEKSLKDKCYIGMLSNLTIFDKERLDRQVDLSQYDYVFLSFEMGCRKPEQEIYEMVENKVPFEKENILFIDDRKDNIESARNMGWNVLQTTGLELDKIKEVCEKFLNS